MNIDINPVKKSNKKKIITSLIALGCMASMAYLALRPAIPTLSNDSLHTVIVQQGDIDIMTPVFGQFASRFERLVSAPANGQVSEIYLRAGTDVTKDTIIAMLSNPDLEQQHFEAESKLERMQSEFASFQFQKQNEQLTFQGELADIDSQIQAAKLDVDVNQRLAKQGIAAKIELERATLKYNQLKKRYEFADYRFSKQKEMHKLELQQQHILLKQQEKQVSLIANKVADLTIKAGISGTLQRLDIELGQRVNQGQAMARVGSKSELMAKLNIPQRIAERINIGAAVILDHKQGPLQGTVKQLGSVVENGYIIAEIHVQSSLPDNVRPAQPVNAKVFVEHVHNALYVEQRAGLKPLSTQPLYKKVTEQALLEQIHITFGELSGRHLLITSGALAGDKIITNNLSQWHTYSQLALDNAQL